MSLSRMIALTWIGLPPHEASEAVFDGDVPTRDNVRWGSPVERMKKLFVRAGRGKKVTTIQISNALAHHLIDTRAEDARMHGLGYVAETLLRRAVGMEPLPTPIERKKKRAKGTKRAGILLDVRRGETNVEVLADRHDTTPAYAKRIIEKEGISLRALRLRQKRERAVARITREQRDANIVTEANTGLFSRRELAERYGLSENQIQSILNKNGISLAEAKARQRGDLDRPDESTTL